MDYMNDDLIVNLIKSVCSEWSLEDPIIYRGFLGVRRTIMNNDVSYKL